ncbi:REJ domain protein (macronuclear) [Tetrahymena thermophila SB210]|uniref:REJ domain protein n=1 Tax=Tetrahymena thermophila (strain SB210) TaxID=312017 RepID=Q23ED7_TETTS|nr:REJ domain protein [Tetrahymena thermophila SB210]EAR94920.2 REJ domain protein [Tetrahymena thermophila SB210]|eukprot:XP_001015165.2 REJ domain protein [Tetrahymena thermophila SB210]
MKVNTIKILFFSVLNILIKFASSYADYYSNCTQVMMNLGLNPKYSECVINKLGVENESDLLQYKMYLKSDNCLNIVSNRYEVFNYLSGDGCFSNIPYSFTYSRKSSFQKINKFYLEIFGLVSTKETSSLMKISLNGVEITRQLYGCWGAQCYFFNTKKDTLINSYDLNVILTPLNSDTEKYQQYIRGNFLIVQLCSPYCDECDQDSVCSKCIEKYYLDSSGSCQPCDQTCLNCSGPSKENCLSCISGLFFQQKSSSCVQNCDQNQYPDSQNVCQLCDQSCAICQGAGPNNCLSCQLGLYLQPITHSCQLCDQTCSSCDGAGPNSCMSCIPGLYYQPNKKQCVQNCDLNQFINSLNQCQPCDLSCASCDGSSSKSCLSCPQNSFLFNKMCVGICPNGFQSNLISLTCDQCQNYMDPKCNSCYPSCQLCKSIQAKDSQCDSCYSETRQLDSDNNCTCLNPKDQRNNFYQCSYQNIAVLDIQLSATKPLLIIDFGSPLKGISVDTSLPICQQIFDQPTLILLGSDSLCQITGNQVQVNLGDSSVIMANNIVNFLPNKLQFEDYNTYFINTFYRNIVFQNDPGIPLLNFNYNPNENSCNPLSIALQNIQNDAGRKFLNINWTLVQVIGTMSDQQKQIIKKILQQASQDMATSINIDPKYIPSNQNIAIQFNYQLKVNKAGSQLFTINYLQQKYIRINFQQSVYPPIYRYMSLSFYFQFYIEICELGLITYNNEPVDLQLISNQFQQQNLSQYSQSSYQFDISPYSLESNSQLKASLVVNLSSNKNVVAIKKISVDILITDLYLQVIGGSSLVIGYQSKLTLNTNSRDFEIQDSKSPQNINFSWECSGLSSNDHICYDYKNNILQLQQGQSSISFPAKTFQPYTSIILNVIGQKDSRKSNYRTICLFTELNIPQLEVQFSATRQNQKINLNEDLNFVINYDKNIPSDILTYAGALLYDNDVVGVIKFDYYQVKFRIWNYFKNVDPLKPIIQARFSVYNPSFVMPSLTTINLNINFPPHNCTLVISPLQGVALQTMFSIQFLYCLDEDLPLTYQFFYYNSMDDAKQELIQPWNILRRQIQDQSTVNSIQTVLPQGNLVIMSQVIDSQLGVYNQTQMISVSNLNLPTKDYYQQVNQLTQQTLSSTNLQATSQLITLSLIGEDISKNTQSSQDLNNLCSLLITNLQQLSLQIPKFSLISTYANKVTAKLSGLLFNSQQSIQTIDKNQIIQKLQLLIQNTDSSIQNNDLSHLQQNNDFPIQNMIDSFKILNSCVTMNSQNTQQNLQDYDQITTKIGSVFSNMNLPNQGSLILNGNLSTLLIDKITQKNIYQYVTTFNEPDLNNIFSISRNNYELNIYENTPQFQAYIQQMKNISSNYTYSKNKLIQTQITNLDTKNLIDHSTIIYNFNNAVTSMKYNMACVQQNDKYWSKQNCILHKNNQNESVCYCNTQKPTTIIEDIDDMFLKNENLNTALGEQGFKNIENFKEKKTRQNYSPEKFLKSAQPFRINYHSKN